MLAALFDPLRYRLFRLLETPRSVAELAGEIGVPANRLYYHVRRLVSCGLVRQVDARASGRHTERIYGRTAARIRFSGDVELRGGEGLLLGIADELERGLASARERGDPGLLTYHAVSLTPEEAHELEERLGAVIAEYERARPAAGGRRFGVLGVVAPLPKPEQP